MSFIAEDKEYKERLLRFEYTEEQADEAIKFRSGLEHCPFEMYTALFQNGAITRTRKLRKVRNIFTDGDKFFYLNHYLKRYEWCAMFKTEEDEK